MSTIISTHDNPHLDSGSDPLTSPLEALYWTQYGTWYPIFRKHAPKSTVIDIDAVQPEVLDWMDADTFVLPEGSGPSTAAGTSSSRRSDSDDDEETEEDEEEEKEAQVVKLPQLDAAIRAAIAKYDSSVFPKLNWSAPLDSSFMLAGNNLQCLHPDDVYLLLKSSEFVARDLEQITHASSARIRPQLVLKKWFALNRSYEFRCFVRSGRLIAICQRDVTFYDHLQSAGLQARIKGAVCDFFEDVLVAEAKWGLKDYVADVYLTKDLGRVWLLDINPWLPRTDPLLFDFDELEAVHRRERRLRAVTRQTQPEQLERGVVRLHLATSTDIAEEGGQEWQESDIQLRILSDRRLSAAGTGATYSSNMVPQDLVELAKTNPARGADMSVDQIVKRWNEQVESEEA